MCGVMLDRTYQYRLLFGGTEQYLTDTNSNLTWYRFLIDMVRFVRYRTLWYGIYNTVPNKSNPFTDEVLIKWLKLMY